MMFLAVDNIYDVMYAFWAWAFPSAIITAYNDIFVLLTMILTFIIIFSLILVPLYRAGTFWLRKGRGR